MRKLNVHKLVEDLDNICSNLNSEYSINCGGCCFVAYVIAKHLDRLNIKYSLQIMNDFPKNLEEINKEVKRKMFNTWEEMSVSGENTCCHYYLKIDGGGTVNEGSFSYAYYIYTISDINHRNIGWIYKNSCWNSKYKRRNNKLIKKVISSHFKQYGKSRKVQVCGSKSSTMPSMQVRC